MSKADIGAKIGIDGEKEFKDQIGKINNSLKTMSTELKAVTAEFGKNETSEEALTAKNKVLNQQIGLLNDKLDKQNQKLKEARAKYDEASPQVQYYQQEVNKTREALAKAENEVDKNNQALKENADANEKAAEKEKKHIDVLGGLTTAFTVLATAAGGAVTAIAKMTFDSGEWADDLNTLSKQTGISTEDLQKYQYAAERIDVPIETLTGSMSKLTRNMSQAKKGTGKAADAFASLGVDIKDAQGNLRDNEDVFKDAIKALGRIENETERDAVAMDIFGKSAQDLNPLILGGADALEELGKQAENAGLILDQQSIDKLNGVADAVDTLKASFDGLKNIVSVEFAEPFAAAVDLVTGYIQQISSSFDGSLDSLSQSISTVLTDLSGKIIEYLPQAVSLGSDIVFALVEGLLTQLPQMLDVAVQIIVTLSNSLSEHLPELIPVAVEAVLTLVDSLIDNIDLLVEASIQLMLALTQGLLESLPILIEKAPVLVEKLCGAVSDEAPKMRDASIEIVGQLVEGIIQNAGQLNKACWKIVETIWDSFVNLYRQDYIEMGKNMVMGIWEGIKSATQWLIGRLTGWFNDVVGAVKRFLKIESPSKLMADEVGSMMAKGVAVGWDKEFDSVARDINGSMASLLPDSTANIGIRENLSGARTLNGIRGAMADSVNAIGSLLGGGNGDLNVQFVVNGREFYRATLADFRLIQAQNPIIVNDF